MTFNVLCFFCDDINYDPFEQRLDYFGDILHRHDPDLVGFQELLFADEVDELLARKPDYEAIFFADESQPLFEEYADATIFFRADRFEAVAKGFYWLSETPDIPVSGGWASANLPRLVTWAHLVQKSDDRHLYFATTHVDNNPPNQEMSAPLIVERTGEWSALMPAIIVGDFNSKPDSPAYAILTAPAEEPGGQFLNTFDLADQWMVETNQEPPPAWEPDDRIDHLFVAGDTPWQVPLWVVDMHVYGPEDRYPSDHFAMVAHLQF